MTAILVPLNRIFANPWQTRVGEPDAEYIKELAMDIAQNGLLQTPVGRMIREDGEVVVSADEITRTTGWTERHPKFTVHLAFGHNRLAAYRWINDVQPSTNITGDYTAMPVELRSLTDEQMADCAWSENEKRRDHTPIERALAIEKRMQDFGWTQVQIAEHLGISRPSVSNALRLLKLPEEITSALASGKISERVAMALAGMYDLPETLQKKIESNWYPPKYLVREALSGQLTSDGVRDKITRWCLDYGVNLAKAEFPLDEPFMIPDVVAPFCRECSSRYKERNLCLDKKCYGLKKQNYQAEQLKGAQEATGIPVLEVDPEKSGHENYTQLNNGWRSDRDGWKATIVAGRCENLRLRFVEKSEDVPDHPHAEIVCSKREQFCSCLNGMKATTPTTTYHYNYETHESTPLVDPPAVVLESAQPSAEDLKEAATQARRKKRRRQRKPGARKRCWSRRNRRSGSRRRKALQLV